MTLKQKLLYLFKLNTEEYISGEQLCRQLGVSRTAIWKQVENLRQMGYIIEARSNAGYRLVSIPDCLYPEEILFELKTNLIGKELVHFNSIESTNNYAKDWARNGAAEGAVVVAEEQRTGKGRMGRGWFSPRSKGLWFSVILRPLTSPVDVSQITMVAVVAVAEAIKKMTGLALGIKWPNDLLAVGGSKRKLCGILSEMDADMDRVKHVVVGIGVNVNILYQEVPSDLRDILTSLLMETGAKVDRIKLLQNILREFDYWYSIWLNQGFRPVKEQWKYFNITLGRRVKVLTLREIVEGIAEDIDDRGTLLVKLDNGQLRSFIAGEVSLTGNGYT